MQISKTLLTLGTAALCLASVSSRAVDSEADLKLREALHQKMSEVGPETAAPTPAPAPSKPVKVTAPKKAKPVAPAAPVAPAPVVKSAPVAPPPVKRPAKPVVVAPPVVQSAPVAEPVQPPPAAMNDEQAERLREAVRVRLAQEAANPAQPQPPIVTTHGSDLEPTISTTKIVAPTTQTAPPVQMEAPAAPVVKAPVVLEAPALPISGSKEQRLATLLQQYKADLISPQQYHEQRAKIIAE